MDPGHGRPGASGADTKGERLSQQAQVDARVVLADIRDQPLSVDEVIQAVSGPEVGGIGLFVGTVRRHDHGRGVDTLDYTAHPSAADVLRATCAELLDDDVIAIAAVHRTGLLQIGDAAVVIAVSAAHRATALTTCHALIDAVKTTVPIWKQQQFTDGTDEWVGLA